MTSTSALLRTIGRSLQTPESERREDRGAHSVETGRSIACREKQGTKTCAPGSACSMEGGKRPGESRSTADTLKTDSERENGNNSNEDETGSECGMTGEPLKTNRGLTHPRRIDDLHNPPTHRFCAGPTTHILKQTDRGSCAVVGCLTSVGITTYIHGKGIYVHSASS